MRFPLTLSLFFMALNLAAQNVQLRAHVPLNEMTVNPTQGSDIWGFTDPNGREYAIMTTNRGTSFFDITNPDAPVEIGSVSGNTSTWRDVKVYTYDDTPENYSAYAFITTEASGYGIQVVDLSDVPNSVAWVATYNGFNNVHNILMPPEPTSPYAYICGSNVAGMVILDISDPLNPQQRGNWANYYVHDFFVSTTWADPEYNGREIGLAFAGENNLSILDLSDKDNPTLIQDYTYPGLSYCHSGWMSDDGRYAYVCDEFDERQLGGNTKVYVLDLIDLNNPQLVGTYVGPTRAIDHNIFYKDGLLHMSNYTDGYTLLDATDPINLVRVGNYDTYPSGSAATFNGAWGVYPYYPSGIVAVSDYNSGLYILDPQLAPSFRLQSDDSHFTRCPEQSLELRVDLQGFAGFSNDVTLSVPGLPAGMAVSWSQNPIQPGQSTTMSLTVGPGVVADTYNLSVLGQGTGAADQNLAFNLEILAGPDAAPSYTAPRSDASCLGLTDIQFTWSSLGNERSYHFQLADNPGFKNPMVETTVSQANYLLQDVLTQGQSYFWRVRSENPCGVGEYGPARHLVAGNPHVLLVDDDDDAPNVRSFYSDTLDALNIPYDVFQTNGLNSPDLATLSKYDWVIWFSGDDYNSSGLSDSEEPLLASYIDGGGKLMLSAQDYFYSQGSSVTSFMQAYLGIGAVASDDGTFSSLDGQASLAGLGNIDMTTPIGLKLFDTFEANENGQVVLASGALNAAVETANSLTLGFTFETMVHNDPTQAQALINHYFNAYGINSCVLGFGICGTRDRARDGFDMGDFLARSVLWSSEETLFSLVQLTECL